MPNKPEIIMKDPCHHLEVIRQLRTAYLQANNSIGTLWSLYRLYMGAM